MLVVGNARVTIEDNDDDSGLSVAQSDRVICVYVSQFVSSKLDQ